MAKAALRQLTPIILALIVAAPAGAAAQARWSAAPGLHLAGPLGRMRGYFGGGAGFGMALRRGEGRVALRTEASWTHFRARTVSRPLNGAGPSIGITSTANIFLLLAGPEAAIRVGRFHLALGAEAGGTHLLSTGSTILPGDPAQVDRSNTYATLTWSAAAHASVRTRLAARMDLAIDVEAVQVGRSDFLREYNLPIGVISGIYLHPTPYAPALATARLSLLFPL